MMIEFLDLPMPPTVNRYLLPFRNRLIKGPQARAYKLLIEEWRLMNLKWLSQAKQLIKAHRLLQVERIYKTRVYNANGEVRDWDQTNRNKCMDDCLSYLLDHDDKYFFKTSDEKIPGFETVDIKITPYV